MDPNHSTTQGIPMPGALRYATASPNPATRSGDAGAGGAAGPSRHAPGTAAPVVIDVRSPQEYASGALEGAVSVPLVALEARIRDLVPDRATPIVLYCASGGRSAMACALLARLGYQAVSDAGGLRAAAAALGMAVR